MREITFSEQRLKAHAEPMQAAQLDYGSTYFFLNYDDEDMLVPSLIPVVFVGTNLHHGDESVIYFQDFESFSRGVRFESGSAEATFYCGPTAQTGHVFQFEYALEELMRCSIRRKRAGGPLKPSE